ncbi:MAG: ATP-binding protein [Methyloligellaceae bacterium]
MHQSARTLSIMLMLSFLIVTGVVCAPVIYYTLYLTRQTLIQEKSVHISSLAKNRVEQIQGLLEKNITNLNLVSSRTQLRLSMQSYNQDSAPEHLQKMVRILNDAKLSAPYMKHISLINTEGKVVASTDKKKIGTSVKKSREFLQGKNTGAVHRIFSQQDTPLISVTSPMRLDGKIIGISWSEMGFKEFNDIMLDGTGLGKTGELLITGLSENGENIFLAPSRHNKAISFNSIFAREHKIFTDLVTEGHKNSAKLQPIVDYRGRKAIAAFSNIPKLNWMVMAKIDWSEVEEPIVSEQNSIMIMMAILIVPFIVLCAILSRLLTNAVYMAEEKTNSIIDTAGDAILLIGDNGHIAGINKSAEQLFGYNREELIAKPATILIDPSKRDQYSKLLTRMCEATFTRSLRQMELTAATSSGDIIPMEISVSQTNTAGDIKLIIIGRDITKRREIEETINNSIQKQNELIETQKLFVNIATHEFRTPLSMISNAIQHLERSDESLTEDYLLSKTGKIRFAVGRMLKLIERLLSLSNIEMRSFSLDIKSCNIEELLRHSCDFHQDLAKSHNIVAEIDTLPQFIRADAITLEQILNNLIENTIKYSPEGGGIYISAKEDQDFIEIKIRDTGLGIDADEIPRLFERFFRSTNSVGIAGTGIGLHLVKILTEMHEGTISVESQTGKGSTFILRLPIQGPKQEQKQDNLQTGCAA